MSECSENNQNYTKTEIAEDTKKDATWQGAARVETDRHCIEHTQHSTVTVEKDSEEEKGNRARKRTADKTERNPAWKRTKEKTEMVTRATVNRPTVIVLDR